MAVTKKVAIAKLYKIRAIVDGMLEAVDGDTLDLQQALAVICKSAMRAADEDTAAQQGGV